MHLKRGCEYPEALAGLEFTISFTRDMLLNSNIKVMPVKPEDYMESIAYAEDLKVRISDALTYLIMRENTS